MADSDEKIPLLEKEKKNGNCCKKTIPLYCLLVTIVFCCFILLAACLGVYYGYKNSYIHGQQNTKPLPVEMRSKVNYRLPKALIPTEYYISLQPYLISKAQFDSQKTHLFDGNTTIVFLCQESANNITLNIDNITIHDYWITENGQNDKLDLFERDLPNSFDSVTQKITFPFNGRCIKGKYYAFHVRYTGYLADDLKGFYKTKYTDQGEKRWLAVTHFESTGARRIGPMFDEPAYKAIWHLTLTYPDEMTALGNMNIRKTVQLPHGWKRSTFYPSLKMSSYLLAFFVGDFIYTEGGRANTLKKTMFRVYSRHDFINQTHWAGYCGPKSLTFFEKYLNVEFPLEKTDLLALPEFDAGAMENWGLITYREESLLYDKNSYPPSSKRSVAITTAHELAHQWFGDLVTLDWWADIFLNEAFAEFFEYRGADEIGDFKWDMSDHFVIADRLTAMELDELPTSHAIYKPSETPREFSLLFDTITYDKGNCILSMLNHTLGADVFVEGLHRYLIKYAYSNTHHQDLYDSLQEVVNENSVQGWNGDVLNVTEFMNRWILQMGFPMAKVQRKGNSLLITQSRFLIENETKTEPSPYNYQWYTPLWFKNKENNRIEMTWIQKDQQLILSGFPSDSWYLINPETYGFYRVNYDSDNWLQLRNQLIKDPSPIAVSARAQLLDDAFTMAIAGTLSYDYALNLTCYLGSEKSYVPWAAVYSNLNYIGRMLSQSHNYGLYKQYMRSLVGGIYSHIAHFDSSLSDDYVMWYDLQRSTIKYACQLGHESCRDFALKAFREYMKNCSNTMSSDKCNRLSPNIRLTVYCTAVAEMGVPAFDFLFKKQLIETLNQEAVSIVRALSCARQPWLIVKLITSSINGDLVRNQIRYAYGYLSNNPIATSVVWTWVAENWDSIVETIGDGGFGEGDLGKLLHAATQNFNKEYQYTKVKDFMDSHHNLGTTKPSFENALSRIRTNINWMKKHHDNVINWFRTQSKCLL